MSLIDAIGAPSKTMTSEFYLRLFFLLSGSLAIFVCLMGFDVDLVSVLKLDRVFSQPSNTAYLIVRFTLNLIAAFIAFGSIMGIRAQIGYRAQTLKVSQGDRKKPIEATVEVPVEMREVDRVKHVIGNLDIRINRLSQQSEVIYWTIIVSLIAGVFLIIFAGNLSAWDTTLGSLTSHLEVQLSQIRPSYDENSKQRVYDDNEQNKIKWLDGLYEKAVDATITHANQRPEGRSDWNWPSTILRIGVIGMLVFLTQILISLYRYNSRLIAFYGSRRDALILADQKSVNTDIEKLTLILFPSSFDFGREPRHPLQEMMGFLRGERGDGRRSDQVTPPNRKRNRSKPSAQEPQQQKPEGESSQPTT
jgi:hypothetical protein